MAGPYVTLPYKMPGAKMQGNYGNVPLQTFGGPQDKSIGDILHEIWTWGNEPLIPEIADNFGHGDTGSSLGGFMGTANQPPNAVRGAPVPYGMADTQNAGPEQQLSPADALLQMLMGGGQGSSKSSMHAQMAPYNAGINALQNQLGLAQAQTQQNIADINSWYGQAGALAGKVARKGAKADRKMIKSKGKFDKAILAGLGANKDVQRSYAGGAARGAGNLMNLGAINRAYTADRANDASQMGAYQDIVQQRLGQQMQMGIMDQIAQAKATKASAKATAKSSAATAQQDMLLKILGAMGTDATAAILGPAFGLSPEGGGGMDSVEGGRLASAVGSATSGLFSGTPAEGGEPLMNMQDSLAALRNRAEGVFGRDAMKDPEFMDRYRALVAQMFIPRYNQSTGDHWSWQGLGGGFSQ